MPGEQFRRSLLRAPKWKRAQPRGGKTKLHVSSPKLGVCACVRFVPPGGCARRRLWPLPQLRSIYTYTPGLYTYMYIYTAYVQIEEEGKET